MVQSHKIVQEMWRLNEYCSFLSRINYDYFKEIFECEWDGIYGNKKPGYIFTHGVSSVVESKELLSAAE